MRDGGGFSRTGRCGRATSGYHPSVPGDTLLGIARQYGVTLPDLVSWNRITDPDQIHVGQSLRVAVGLDRRDRGGWGHRDADPFDRLRHRPRPCGNRSAAVRR